MLPPRSNTTGFFLMTAPPIGHKKILSLIYILSFCCCAKLEPSYNTPPCEAPMHFSIRPYCRFPVQ